MIETSRIKKAVREIARLFQPQRIILFGSHAHGNATNDSDVDLLVLLKGKRVHDRALAIRKAVDFGFPVDLLVRSPDEFRRRIDMGDFFLKEIEDEGKVLYEASDARVGEKGGRRLRHGTTRTAGAKVAKPRQRVLSRSTVR
jgi:predicted nucleotidyltransferase